MRQNVITVREKIGIIIQILGYAVIDLSSVGYYLYCTISHSLYWRWWIIFGVKLHCSFNPVIAPQPFHSCWRLLNNNRAQPIQLTERLRYGDSVSSTRATVLNPLNQRTRQCDICCSSRFIKCCRVIKHNIIFITLFPKIVVFFQ